jgi:hypothetical protein
LDVTFREGLAALVRAIDESNAALAGVDQGPEPQLPGSLGRNVLEPIAAAGR